VYLSSDDFSTKLFLVEKGGKNSRVFARPIKINFAAVRD